VDGLPDKPGMVVTAMIPKARSGEIKAMYIMGENPLVSDADANHVEEALKSLDFLVVQDLFMTETAELADLVLPSACFAEKEGTFTNTERRVQRIRKAATPPGEAREDWWIPCRIAKRMGFEMEYEDSEEIFEEIGTVASSYAGTHHRTPPVPLSHRDDDHEIRWSERPGAGRLRGNFRAGRGGGWAGARTESKGRIAPGKDRNRSQHLRQGRAGHGIRAVPFRNGRRQPPDLRRARPRGQNPGIQGLRGKALQGIAAPLSPNDRKKTETI
jgi:anaerobic selenocysteine-containing dehydrogenase